MHLNVRSAFLLSAVTLVSACATPAKSPEFTELPVHATVAWGNQGRGGAAERVAGYVHVLRSGGVVYRDAPASSEPQASSAALASPDLPPAAALAQPDAHAVAQSQNNESLPPQTMAAIAAMSAREVTAEPYKAAVAASVSDKQRRAWEKYCDGGYRMTDQDWTLVREAGAPNNAPADLVGRCVHPK